MKLIPLTQRGKNKGKYFAIVDDKDYDYLMQWNWYAFKSRYTYYPSRGVYNGKGKSMGKELMHRIILGLTDPKIKGDHKNGNGLDCQRHNLRISTNSQNGANRRSRISSTSKYLGVGWYKRKNKWHIQITFNSKNIHLGYSNNEIEAALIYNEAAIKYHGEFARLNIIK